MLSTMHRLYDLDYKICIITDNVLELGCICCNGYTATENECSGGDCRIGATSKGSTLDI